MLIPASFVGVVSNRSHLPLTAIGLVYMPEEWICRFETVPIGELQGPRPMDAGLSVDWESWNTAPTERLWGVIWFS